MNEELRHSSAHVFVDDPSAPVLTSDDAHHLSAVLRLQDGESVSCSDGRGAWAMGEWKGKGVVPVGEVHFEKLPQPELVVAIAPIKGDRTDLVVEKLVEIGIDRICILQPVERSVVRWQSSKIDQIMKRYSRIIRAGAMQSRRVFLPMLEGPIPLARFTGAGVAFAEPGGNAQLEDVSTLVIGPEGGFSPNELLLAQAHLDLGPSILRAETAAMVGAARMVAHWRR